MANLVHTRNNNARRRMLLRYSRYRFASSLFTVSAASKNAFRPTTMTSCATQHNFAQQGTTKQDPWLPTMIVFDLDDCLWYPEMHELPGMPSVPVRGDLGNGQVGVVGLQVKRGRATVQLYPGARQALHRLASDPMYRGILLAAASTSLEPTYSDACLQHIEILPGLTLDQMMTYRQIGRSGRLNSDKCTHFQLLHEESGVPYTEMLFFDDCNWGDHVGRVGQAYGVVGKRTPQGLTLRDFERGLEKFRQQAASDSS